MITVNCHQGFILRIEMTIQKIQQEFLRDIGLTETLSILTHTGRDEIFSFTVVETVEEVTDHHYDDDRLEFNPANQIRADSDNRHRNGRGQVKRKRVKTSLSTNFGVVDINALVVVTCKNLLPQYCNGQFTAFKW